MRAVIQRVEQASVTVEGEVCGQIGPGLLVLLAVEQSDDEKDLLFINRKILNLRVFEDDQGRMNRSLLEVGGEILVVSQFTLYGDCRKGNRPSYSRAAAPEQAERLYDRLIEEMRREKIRVQSGRFQAMMKVALVNDGPVTLIVDSK
jgi:D-aminoacyl-tRNA deacylase